MNSSNELRAFVRAAKQQGATDEFLVAMLRDKGWPAKDVYAVFAQQWADQTGVALPEPPGRLEAAREAFFHLLAFGSLGTWIFSIGSVWFDLISAWLPDSTMDRLDGPVIGRISNQLASIIVAFPTFFWATQAILTDQVENPEKAESAVRRWVSNIGLLLTAFVFLGDLIVFFTSLLQGELTTRFALRCLVVVVLAGAVFLYYSRGLGKSRTLPPVTWHRLFAACALLTLALTLGLGFWSNGSPLSVRVLNEDNQRVRDLYDITVQFKNKKLNGLKEFPTSLADVSLAETDPFTGAAYEYRKLDGGRYQVCAVFGAPSPKGTSGGARFWAHPAGHKCFDIASPGDVPYPPNYFR